MKTKLQLPFEYYFLPEDTGEMLKAGNSFTIIDMLGFLLCTEGSLELQVNQDKYIMHKSDLFFFPNTSFVHLLNVSDDFKGIVTHSSHEFVMPLVSHVLDVRSQIYIATHMQLSLTESQSNDIMELMMSIYDRMLVIEKEDIEDNRRVVLIELIKSLAMALGYEIMNIYLSNYTLETSTPDRNDLVVLQFMISIDSNYQKERSVAFYASEQCLTYSYFSQIVKEKTGHSALHWIVQKVIADAKHMLEYTHVSIKEIANRLNFPTQSFFGKYFKQYAGVSPKEYRLRNQRQSELLPIEQTIIKVTNIDR
jgi:AraC family transcriptional regulator, transcriptional activator of pobA